MTRWPSLSEHFKFKVKSIGIKGNKYILSYSRISPKFIYNSCFGDNRTNLAVSPLVEGEMEENLISIALMPKNSKQKLDHYHGRHRQLTSIMFSCLNYTSQLIIFRLLSSALMHAAFFKGVFNRHVDDDGMK